MKNKKDNTMMSPMNDDLIPFWYFLISNADLGISFFLWCTDIMARWILIVLLSADEA